MATEVEIAWAAGLFEGEGCFTGTTRRHWILNKAFEAEYFQVQMSLSMTDEDIVRRFHSIVDCGGVIVRNFEGNLKRQWMWQGQAVADVERLYLQFKPWLGVRRLDRIEELFQKANEIREFREEAISLVRRAAQIS